MNCKNCETPELKDLECYDGIYYCPKCDQAFEAEEDVDEEGHHLFFKPIN